MQKQSFTRDEVIAIIENMLMMAGQLHDAITSEYPKMSAEDFLDACE